MRIKAMVLLAAVTLAVVSMTVASAAQGQWVRTFKAPASAKAQ